MLLKFDFLKSKDDYENQLNSMRSLHLAEKNDYQFKFEDLQIKYDRANSKINDVKKFHEKVMQFFLIELLTYQEKFKSLKISYFRKKSNIKPMPKL